VDWLAGAVVLRSRELAVLDCWWTGAGEHEAWGQTYSLLAAEMKDKRGNITVS
jgi:hypothetical protein